MENRNGLRLRVRPMAVNKVEWIGRRSRAPLNSGRTPAIPENTKSASAGGELATRQSLPVLRCLLLPCRALLAVPAVHWTSVWLTSLICRVASKMQASQLHRGEAFALP